MAKASVIVPAGEITDPAKAKSVYDGFRTVVRRALDEDLSKEATVSYFHSAWKYETDKANSKKLEKFEAIVGMLSPAMKIILANMTPARINSLSKAEWAALMTDTFEEKEVTVIIK